MGPTILQDEDFDRIPLSTTRFSELRALNQIYIDKSNLIYKLARQRTPFFFFFSRRFGKSLLLSTFDSLFSKGLEDFKGLSIEKLWTENKTYPVAKFSLANYRVSSISDFNEDFCQSIVREFTDILPHPEKLNRTAATGPNSLLEECLKQLTGSSVVILIDEYDAPLTHTLDEPDLNKQIVSYLGAFFNTLKDYKDSCRFIFITGITRIAHVSLFSTFNNLNEITLDDDYSSLLGITESELHNYFDSYVENAASVLEMSKDEVYERLKLRYNGNRFSVHANESVYNPWSVLSFLSKPHNGFENYWYQSSAGTPTLLINYLKDAGHAKQFSELSESEELYVTISELKAKSEAAQIPMNLLLQQTGYYTLQYNSEADVILAYPNEEVEESIFNLKRDLYNLKLSSKTNRCMLAIPEYVDAADIESLKTVFNKIITESITPDTGIFNREVDIRNLIYISIPDSVIYKSRENVNAFGFADMQLVTRKTKLVIEFKRSYKTEKTTVTEDQALDSGLKQLKEKHYGEGISDKKLIRVAIVISQEKRALTKWQILDV